MAAAGPNSPVTAAGEISSNPFATHLPTRPCSHRHAHPTQSLLGPIHFYPFTTSFTPVLCS